MPSPRRLLLKLTCQNLRQLRNLSLSLNLNRIRRLRTGCAKRNGSVRQTCARNSSEFVLKMKPIASAGWKKKRNASTARSRKSNGCGQRQSASGSRISNGSSWKISACGWWLKRPSCYDSGRPSWMPESWGWPG